MKLEDARQAYYDKADKASEISRQLSLAALAIVWIFKADLPNGQLAVPPLLLWASLIAVAALAFDLFHYAYGALAWGRYHRYKEQQDGINEKTEFLAPAWMNWPAIFFFWGKLALAVACYVLLFIFLRSKVAM